MDHNVSKQISKPTEKVCAAEEERARTSKKCKNNDRQGQTVQKNGGDVSRPCPTLDSYPVSHTKHVWYCGHGES